MKVKKEFNVKLSLKLIGLFAGLGTILPAFIIPIDNPYALSVTEILIQSVVAFIVLVVSGYVILFFRVKLILLEDGFINIGHLKTVYMRADDVASCIVAYNKITITSKDGASFSIDKRWEGFNELKEDELIKRLSEKSQP